MKRVMIAFALLAATMAMGAQVKVIEGVQLKDSSDYATSKQVEVNGVGQAFPVGTVLDVIGTYGDYVHVTNASCWDGSVASGWVWVKLVADGKITGQGADIVDKPCSKRKGSVSIGKTIKAGTAVTVDRTEVTWYNVTKGSLTGWVYAGCVEKVAEAPKK